jgi:HNH endonuclease
MAIRSASMPADAQRPEPLITFVVDYPSALGRICRIEGGPVVSLGSVLHHLDRAAFERIVFAPDNRIECSHKARFFTGGTRRAIEVRDLECSSPFCETPASRCQVDHIIPYSKGGLTTQDNGRLLCSPCNRMRNVTEPPWAFAPPGGWSQAAAEHWPDPMVVPEPPSTGPESSSTGPEPPGG